MSQSLFTSSRELAGMVKIVVSPLTSKLESSNTLFPNPKKNCVSDAFGSFKGLPYFGFRSLVKHILSNFRVNKNLRLRK
jgi:hypothetical protein